MADPPTMGEVWVGARAHGQAMASQGMMEDVRALVEYAMPSELQLGMNGFGLADERLQCQIQRH